MRGISLSGRVVFVPDHAPLSYPRVTPYLYYEDGTAAIEWLVRVFGFTERLRMMTPEGLLQHGELAFGESVIMLASVEQVKNPKRLGQTTGGVYVRVDDVDAHYAHAVAAGAVVEGEPSDKEYGDRIYGVLDPEGHQWWFAQPLPVASPL